MPHSHFKKKIRDVHDFPKKGIVFKDITPILADKELFSELVDLFYERYRDKKIKVVAGIESRGFLFGAPLAYALGASFVPVRKKGKLPHTTVSCTYELEYGQDSLEIHTDAITKGDNVILIDDLLATGGTASAVAEMIKSMGGNIVEVSFFIELLFLKGKDKLKGYEVFSCIQY